MLVILSERKFSPTCTEVCEDVGAVVGDDVSVETDGALVWLVVLQTWKLEHCVC